MDVESLYDLFSQDNASGHYCFNYSNCQFRIGACNISDLHTSSRYSDVSAVWVLICAIIVFFMKTGFLFVEISFARDVVEKRHVVVVKYLDCFASSFGFFLIGFDVISGYTSPQYIQSSFFSLTDPVLWFFKFTFASNAATIIGGCLVNNSYKLRLPAAFLSAFIISGIIHPLIARIIWTDKDTSLSPYRFCSVKTSRDSQGFNCEQVLPLTQRLYILDFAGGGAVHLLGGTAGLVLCLFAKLQKWRDDKQKSLSGGSEDRQPLKENAEVMKHDNFWDWMYPVDGGGETTSEAALGVLILWFCWFAFNCGSTESIQSSRLHEFGNDQVPYHAVPSIIAVNMIMAGASGGVVAVMIAVWAQLRKDTQSVNANEIANGVLSALVAITSGCPFVSYWSACIIGVVAVVLYHAGCYLEYKLGIEDTARVVPVHAVNGLWSLLSVGLFLLTQEDQCILHATFEGLCFCELRLPPLGYGERLAAQLVGAVMMIGFTVIICGVMYGILFLLPISCSKKEGRGGSCVNCLIGVCNKISMIVFGHQNISFKGNWLFTSPKDSFSAPLTLDLQAPIASHNSNPAISPQGAYGSLRNRRESLGTVEQGTGRAGNRITSNQRATISRSRNTNKSHNFKAVPVSSNLNSDYSTDEEREQL